MFTKITGKGKDLLCIHGAMSDHTHFDGLAELLKDRYRLMRYDRRGYGEEPLIPEDGDYSIERQAEDAMKLIREHADGPVWILGDSAGGMVGIELARRYSDLVQGLILMETPLVFDQEQEEQIEFGRHAIEEASKSGNVAKVLACFAEISGIGSCAPKRAMSLEGMRRSFRNVKQYLEGEKTAVWSYRPELASLKEITCPVHGVITDPGREKLFGGIAEQAMKHAGWPISYLSGDHGIIAEEPEKFANLLKSILEDE